MNYRHAFHAGNHTELFKHTALVLLLRRMLAKPKPFLVLDTHAGAGLYEIGSAEALRTGEFLDGVGRLDTTSLPAASAYGDAIGRYLAQELYPGSPTIIADILRPNDRLIACELREDDAARLRRLFACDRRVSVHRRDGYEAMLALVPPAERRGFVFIDPPFEQIDEAARIGEHLLAAARKWPTGTFAVWYPYKDGRIASEIARTLARAPLANVFRADLIRTMVDGVSLAGGGMIFVNPPWQFDEELRAAAGDLLSATGNSGGRFEATWLSKPT